MNNFFESNGKPFFILGGQCHNTTTYSNKELEIFWNSLEALKANTAEVPIYWEALEPEEGKFDFSTLDNVIYQARERKKHLVILWFGTWKNGGMKYTPVWIKKDTERFKRVISHDGSKLFVLSSHCKENFEADKKVFTEIIRHIKEIDESEKTVIAVQVENEPGISGRSYRDFGEEAEAEFKRGVPRKLIEFIKDKASGELYEQWKKCGEKMSGNWYEVFGVKRGAEYFTGWSISSYIDRLAEAGKEIYNIPMYVNAALDRPPYGWDLAGTNYSGGGPATKLYDLWKFNTPHIDLIAPDIYMRPTAMYNFACETYDKENNPLFVPESGSGIDGSNFKNMFYAIGKYNAIGYSIFGAEDILDKDGNVKEGARPLLESFNAVSAVMPLLVKYHGTGKIHEVVQEEFEELRLMEFENCHAQIVYKETKGNFIARNRAGEEKRGRGLILEGEKNEFFILGGGFTVYFTVKNDIFYSEDVISNHASYLTVEEGHFDEEENWVVDRIRTGDESDYGIWVYPENGAVRVVICE